VGDQQFQSFKICHSKLWGIKPIFRNKEGIESMFAYLALQDFIFDGKLSHIATTIIDKQTGKPEGLATLDGTTEQVRVNGDTRLEKVVSQYYAQLKGD
jgi:hypothetical protein